MSFIFSPYKEMPEVILIEPKIFEDDRGFFSESFKEKDFLDYGMPPFVQENHSRTSAFCVRGLHYQLKEKVQGKLVRCLRGSIIDVAVDIRRGSPTYGNWVGVKLSGINLYMLYIPPGFAHGFMSYELSDVVYKTTEYYSFENDRCKIILE